MCVRHVARMEGEGSDEVYGQLFWFLCWCVAPYPSPPNRAGQILLAGGLTRFRFFHEEMRLSGACFGGPRARGMSTELSVRHECFPVHGFICVMLICYWVV